MTLQDIFYGVGITYMLLLFMLLIGTAIVLFMIKNKISTEQKNITKKISGLKKVKITRQNIAEDIGSLAAQAAGKL